MAKKYAVPYALSVPTGGVTLTGGRLYKAFENNIGFLKGFDTDRMLYWYRVHKGKKAPYVPYGADGGHFENNLKGQTAGEFLMGACTTLLWKEDDTLRAMARELLSEMRDCMDDDGFIIPIPREEFPTKEYPNYTRAWITFGLLDAGYAGEEDAFAMAREMGDWFNCSDVLPFVKDMNLGFQGILAQTRLYDSPVGVKRDIEVAQNHYEEDWWLRQLIRKDHRAIYDHPGNHPHSTLLTTLEGYLDLYRATGERLYIDAVRSALPMYEDKWQHVGGGISMCEMDTYFPGCNWLSVSHNYNELCSTNFWVLINQRMHRLFPDDAHYVDEMENSLYNVLCAAQVGTEGYHYLNFLEKHKDWRYLDRATCCAAMGTRLAGLLPQFLYTYTEDTVYVDLYAPSTARLPLCEIACETDIPDGGSARITITAAERPFALKLRVPRWAAENAIFFKNGAQAAVGRPSSYVTIEVSAGDVIEVRFARGFRITHYTGAEQVYGKKRFAVEYGPLLYAALGAPNPVALSWDVTKPEEELVPAKNGIFEIKSDPAHCYMPYVDITDEPFSVYPLFPEG